MYNEILCLLSMCLVNNYTFNSMYYVARINRVHVDYLTKTNKNTYNSFRNQFATEYRKQFSKTSTNYGNI